MATRRGAARRRLRARPAQAERRRRRRRSAWRRQLVALAFMSPWIIGFCAFYVYPMIASLYFSFTQYDILSQPEWVGLANYRFMFTSDPLFWLAIRNTLWIIAIMVPLQVLFGDRDGDGADPGQARAAASTGRSSSCPPWSRWWRPRSGSSTCSTRPGRSTGILGLLHLPEPLWFVDPRWTKPGLTPDRPVGHRPDDDHLPGRAAGRAPAAVRGGRPRGGQAVAAVPPRDPADDLAGDLLLGGHRDDPGLPVLHPGLRRLQGRRPGPTRSATPRTRCCSTPSACTSRASRASTWATRPPWPGCCSWSSWSAPLVLIRSSRRWVHYQGGFR